MCSQGEFAEADSETGWNAFELRQYDAKVGRWLSTDPYGQFHSPYVGMGNNPVSAVDPDGGFSVPLDMPKQMKAVKGISKGLKTSLSIARTIASVGRSIRGSISERVYQVTNTYKQESFAGGSANWYNVVEELDVKVYGTDFKYMRYNIWGAKKPVASGNISITAKATKVYIDRNGDVAGAVVTTYKATSGEELDKTGVQVHLCSDLSMISEEHQLAIDRVIAANENGFASINELFTSSGNTELSRLYNLTSFTFGSLPVIGQALGLMAVADPNIAAPLDYRNSRFTLTEGHAVTMGTDGWPERDWLYGEYYKFGPQGARKIPNELPRW